MISSSSTIYSYLTVAFNPGAILGIGFTSPDTNVAPSRLSSTVMFSTVTFPLFVTVIVYVNLSFKSAFSVIAFSTYAPVASTSSIFVNAFTTSIVLSTSAVGITTGSSVSFSIGSSTSCVGSSGFGVEVVPFAVAVFVTFPALISSSTTV